MATVTLQRIRPFQEIQNGVLIGPVTNNLYSVNGLGQVTVDDLDQANLLTQGWLPQAGGGGATGPAGPTGPPGPTGPTGPPGSGGGGGLPAGGATSQVVAMSNAGVGIWHRPVESVNVEDFYPAGYTTKHDGNSHLLSSIFGSLAAAQAVYPWVDDLTPEVDYCAIQAAIDYAAQVSPQVALSTIVIPEGVYRTSATLFLDFPNSLRYQNSAASFPANTPPKPRWTSSATFASGDICIYNGVPYRSLRAGNTGHAPYLIATEVGNDPWWIMYYAPTAIGTAITALSTYTNWCPTLMGKPGNSFSFGQYGTIIKPNFINGIALIVGPSGGATVKDLQIFAPSQTVPFGGANPYGVGIGIAGTGNGASHTTIENVNVTWMYSCFTWLSTVGGLGDNNVLRRCSGGGSFIFANFQFNNQAFIDMLYDCTPNSTVGLCGVRGAYTIFGGNWSAQQEGSSAASYNISSTTAISTGTGGFYWPLGGQYTNSPGATYQNISTFVSQASLAGAGAYQKNLLANAYPDRRGDFNWFIINTPSFGPVPFICYPGMLNLFGGITGGSGYTNGTYYNVPLSGGSGSGRIVNVTVSGGAVTGLTVVNPGTVGYLAGDILTCANTLIGGTGAGWSVQAVYALNLEISPIWVNTYINADGISANYATTTNLQAELQAATKIYAAAVQFPFQGQVMAYNVFLENANTSTCLASMGGFGPSLFSGGYLDADAALSGYAPQFGPNDFQLAHYYAQKTIPYIIMSSSDVILDSWSWGGSGGSARDPVVAYSPGNAFKIIHRDSSAQNISAAAPPIAFWYSDGGPFYTYLNISEMGLYQLWKGPSPIVPTGAGSTASTARVWAQMLGRQEFAGVRPSQATVPIAYRANLNAILNAGSLPAISSPSTDGTGATCPYQLILGRTPYKIDGNAPLEALVGASSGNSDMFESSHDFYSYHQNLTTTNVTGLSWHARGKSWCVFMDANTMAFMFTGLVIGLTTDTANYYVVTGVYPGLGYITVWNLACPGRYNSSSWISGVKGTVYTGTVIRAQPYRIRYVNLATALASSAVTAVVGQEIVADTSGSAWTLTLPATTVNGGTALVPGDRVMVQDATTSFATHNLTVSPNGGNLNSAGANGVFNATLGGAIIFTWLNTTIGWRSNVAQSNSMWSASDAALNGFTLSNGNLTVQTSGPVQWWVERGTISKSSGQLYVEIKSNSSTIPQDPQFGFVNSAVVPTGGGFLGSPTLGGSSIGWRKAATSDVFLNGGFANPGSFAYPNGVAVLNDVFGFAIDFPAGKIWAAYNNTWIGGGNPATGANPSATFTPGTMGALFYALAFDGPGGIWTVQAAAASQTYAPPTGFSALG